MALNVRREGYYDWLKRPTQGERDEELVSALKKIREEHPSYGTQSMIDELPKRIKPSYGKGYRVCRDNHILTKRCKPRGITKADPSAQKAEDLIKRNFTAETPNTKWLTDITEMQCRDGKLYFCPVMDCFDAAILGFSVDDNMRATLCTAALNNAISRYGINKDLIVHSDRGSQFTSHLFRETLENKGIRQSMGHTGSCYDNARIESFFGTFKIELIYKLPLYKMTRDEVRIRIFEWIAYYNLRRRHTANEGKMAPLRKREAYFRRAKTVAA